MRGRRTAATVLLVVGCLSGCATPALNRGALVENAKAAVDSTISATATARLAVSARLDGNATRQLTDVVVTDSETGIAPIEASFGGVDPPSPGEDDLRSSVLDLVGAAGEALASARIAVRRDDTDGMRSAATELETAQAALQALRVSLG